jgi:hypothetical protein
MLKSLIARAGLSENASLAEVVEAVRSMPYGRPMERSAQGALAEWRGTCSTKHALLAAVLVEHWPHTEPQLVHRVYRCTPEDAARSFGPTAAAAVPEEGLWDVHRYLTIELNGNRVVIDVTFPSGPGWDGASSMPVACGRGTDHAAGSDPDADKRVLEEAHCDPSVREPHDVTAVRTEGIEDLLLQHHKVRAEVDSGYQGLARDFPDQITAPPKKPGTDARPDEVAEWEQTRKAQSSRRIRVEHAIAEPRQWRPLQRYIGRREDFDETMLAIAGLVSDRCAVR